MFSHSCGKGNTELPNLQTLTGFVLLCLRDFTECTFTESVHIHRVFAVILIDLCDVLTRTKATKLKFLLNKIFLIVLIEDLSVTATKKTHLITAQ